MAKQGCWASVQPAVPHRNDQRLLHCLRRAAVESAFGNGYIIRSVPASPADREFCLRLAQVAVHAAMTGRTEMIVGILNNYLVHIPMKLASSGRKQVDPQSNLWLSVLQATGQPAEFA